MSAEPIVQIRDINKFYGDNHVVRDLNLDVLEGEFLTILGSSGSGKTTTLRMVGGFEQPTSGEILLSGENVADREPYERDVNTVFQSYALFPHMTIFDNVAYGLRMSKVPKDEITRRVRDILALVQLASPNTETRDERIARVEGLLRQRADEGIELFVLPELWAA